MLVLKTSKTEHKVVIPPDDGKAITFEWHFPLGTFDARMSAREIAAFILPHMPHVLPFFSEQPRIYAEFQKMLLLLATSPTEAIDRVLPWIQPRIGSGPDDLIVLKIDEQKLFAPAPTHFVMP